NDDDDDDDDDDDAQDNDDQEDEGDDDEDDQEEGSDDEPASDKEYEEFIHPSLSTHHEEETRDEESFDLIPKTPKNTDDEGNGKENLGINVGREEGHDEEDEEDELYRDVNINLGRGVQMADVHTTQEFEDSHVTLTPVNPDSQQQSSSMSSQFVTSTLNPTPDAGIESIFETTSKMDVQTPTLVAPLPVSAPTLTPSIIATVTIIQKAPTPLTTSPSTLLQDLTNFSSLFGFDHRLKTLEANFSEFMQMNQFAGAVSSIPKIIQRYMDQRMNEAVKVAVQIQSNRLCDEAQAENDEFLKTIDENMQKIIKEQVKVQVSKILPKIEQTVNEQLEAKVLTWNLYKAIVKAYESDKIILDTYGDTVTLKRRRDDDADKDKEPSARSDRGSERQRGGNEPDESSTTEEPMQTTHEMEEPSHPEFETGADDQPIVEPSQHLEWFSQQKKPPTPNLDWNKTLSATHGSIQPHALWGISHWGRKRQQFYVFAVNRESAHDVYSKRRIFPATELKIVEWNNYKHLDWITVRRDDDKLYKFKEGDFKRLRIQDIEDMLLLLKKLNLTRMDTYCSDLKRKEAYIAYSNPRGFIYQNKDKQNRLMQIDELHKFSNGTLTDVRTAVDDRFKDIQMKYLQQSIWRKNDKDRAATMVQAIDKLLKTRRIMRSLERFVGGRLYEGDFRMLQRTI
nr:hypothetical protein [Tanacetum cinerariifolium]